MSTTPKPAPASSQSSIPREAIQHHLQEFCQRKGSQNKAANAMGISAGTVSAILNGDWAKIGDAMWRQVAAYVMPSNWKLIDTAALATICNVLSDAKEHSLMRWVSGPTGVGKTESFKYFAGLKENAGTFYVLCQEAMSVKDVLCEILQEMGVDYEGSRYAMLKKIANTLRGIDRPLLIMDDAGKLSDKKLHIVQQIYDLTEGHAGIIISGLEYNYDNLVKAAKRHRMGAPELKRRIGFNKRVSFSKQLAKEMAAIAKANGVEDGEVVKALCENCSDFGSLRNAIALYRRLTNPTAEALRAELQGQQSAR